MNRSGPIPQSAALFSALGKLMRQLGDDPRIAAAQARELLRRYPGQPLALSLLVSARRLAGDITGARNILQALAKAEPGLAAVQYELGLLVGETGDTEGAIAAFSRVVELEPSHSDAWRDLGDHLSDAGNSDAARSAYARHFEVLAGAPQRDEDVGEGKKGESIL